MTESAPVTYVLCMLTSIVSAVLLARGVRGPGGRLLLWASIFFVGMALNNLALVIDALYFSGQDWSIVANVIAAVSVLVFVYALVWETT
jgi:hypothetical protein